MSITLTKLRTGYMVEATSSMDIKDHLIMISDAEAGELLTELIKSQAHLHCSQPMERVTEYEWRCSKCGIGKCEG